MSWHLSALSFLLAFNLYCLLPFGKLHCRNKEIIELAGLIGRTPSALAMKLCNIASIDPAITSSGLSDSRLLIASHIVPWSKDRHNRLNPRNGLCLSALHDKAFDRGLISLDDDFRVMLSTELEQRDEPFVREFFHSLAGQTITLPERFMPDRGFLQRHRQEVFVDVKAA